MDNPMDEFEREFEANLKQQGVSARPTSADERGKEKGKPDPDGRPGAPLTPGERPVIECIGGKLHVNADEAEDALINAGAPLYARGQTLVMPVVDEVDAARGGKTKVARVKHVTADCLTDHLCRAAVFVTFDWRAKEFVEVNPPAYLAKTILSRDGEWRFRRLAGVITTPTLRRDGSILREAGYDPATKLLLLDPPEIPPIPDRPSHADATAALALLDSLLDEFPFVDKASRSVALSALITPVVRGAMTVAPLHAISAPAAGTGKSYLVELAYAIGTGQMPPAMAAARNDEETEKRVASAILAGRSLISIDNVNGEIGGDLLCQLVERPVVSVRVLGESRLVDVECNSTVFANGNNIMPRADLVRRVLLCSLDANAERPEKRTFATDPLANVIADRGKYIAAALTVVRAFIAADSPERPPPLASYGEWSAIVRAPLMWLGREDPVKTQETVREKDPELTTFASVMTQLKVLLAEDLMTEKHPLTTGKIKEAADEKLSGSYGETSTYKRQKLRQALIDAAGARGDIDTRKLGKLLGRFNGRIIDAHKLTGRYNSHSKQLEWSVVSTGR